MLKIKESVDLKELEKYGFIKMDNDYAIAPKNLSYDCICVSNDRILCLGDIEDYDVLYDLIKADLVEKVEDSNES